MLGRSNKTRVEFAKIFAKFHANLRIIQETQIIGVTSSNRTSIERLKCSLLKLVLRFIRVCAECRVSYSRNRQVLKIPITFACNSRDILKFCR